MTDMVNIIKTPITSTSENTSSCHYGTSCLYGVGLILTATTLFYGGYWYRGRSTKNNTPSE